MGNRRGKSKKDRSRAADKIANGGNGESVTVNEGPIVSCSVESPEYGDWAALLDIHGVVPDGDTRRSATHMVTNFGGMFQRFTGVPHAGMSTSFRAFVREYIERCHPDFPGSAVRYVIERWRGPAGERAFGAMPLHGAQSMKVFYEFLEVFQGLAMEMAGAGTVGSRPGHGQYEEPAATKDEPKGPPLSVFRTVWCGDKLMDHAECLACGALVSIADTIAVGFADGKCPECGAPALQTAEQLAEYLERSRERAQQQAAESDPEPGQPEEEVDGPDQPAIG